MAPAPSLEGAGAPVALVGPAMDDVNLDLDLDLEVAKVACTETGLGEESEMLDFVSFEGHYELLRGVKLSTVMRGAGQLFSSSEGSEETYRLSRQVEELGYFISHNWCIPRGAKYLSLVFKFNVNSALLAVFLCHLCCTIAAIKGAQPGVYSSDVEYPVCIACRLFGVPSVFLGLYCGGKFWGSWRSPHVFLDKVCIDQSSERSQRAGIEKLGAFLRSSNRMLALYSDVYLTKLWTIFEVAGFLTMHSASDLDLLPVTLPCVFVLLLLCHWLYLICHILWHYIHCPAGVSHLVTLLAAIGYAVVIRQWTKHKAQIMMHLTTFEVRKATCAQESDRAIVYDHIASLLKAAGHVPRTATVEECLDVFDHRVRRQMATQFHYLFGTHAFSYKEYLLLSLTSVTPIFLDYLGQIGHGAQWQEVLRQEVFAPFWLFVGLPLWQMALEDSTSHCLNTTGWAEAALVLSMAWGCAMIGTVLLYFTELLGRRARTDDTLLFACMGVVVISTLTSFLLLPRLFSKRLNSRSRTSFRQEDSMVGSTSTMHPRLMPTTCCSEASHKQSEASSGQGSLSLRAQALKTLSLGSSLPPNHSFGHSSTKTRDSCDTQGAASGGGANACSKSSSSLRQVPDDTDEVDTEGACESGHEAVYDVDDDTWSTASGPSAHSI